MIPRSVLSSCGDNNLTLGLNIYLYLNYCFKKDQTLLFMYAFYGFPTVDSYSPNPPPPQYQLWKYSPKEEVRERSLNTLSIYHLKNNRRKMTVSIVGQGAQAYLEVSFKPIMRSLSPIPTSTDLYFIF